MSDDGNALALGWIITAFFIIFILSLYIGTIIEYFHIKFMHESAMAIMLGLLGGVIIYFCFDHSTIKFNEYQFFYLILPPIIFSGGYCLSQQSFFQNFKYIITFGLGSTVINYIVMAIILYLWSKWGLVIIDIEGKLSMKEPNIGHKKDVIKLHIQEILFVSATLSSSDAVAPLALINQTQYPKLFNCIFGEGTMNDIVAIILFTSVHQISKVNSETIALTATNVGKILGAFLVTIVSSLLIGILSGSFSSLLLKYSRFVKQSSVQEMSILFLLGLISYIVPQSLALSGITSLMTCAILMRHYSYHNLSSESQKLFAKFVETVAHLLEGFLFIYMGICCFISKSAWSFSLIGGLLISLIIARFVAVFILSTILWFIGKYTSNREQFWNIDLCENLIISTAGLIRGSIAAGLICSLPDELAHGRVIITSVFGVVVFTSGFIGSFVGKFIELILSCSKKVYPLRIPKPAIELSVITQKRELRISHTIMLQNEQKKESSRLYRCFIYLDNKYFKPFFIYNYGIISKASYFDESVEHQIASNQESVTGRLSALPFQQNNNNSLKICMSSDQFGQDLEQHFRDKEDNQTHKLSNDDQNFDKEAAHLQNIIKLQMKNDATDLFMYE